MGNSKLRKKKELQFRRVRVETEEMLENSKEITEEILQKDHLTYNQINYMNKISGYPIHRNYGIEYFKIGEDF